MFTRKIAGLLLILVLDPGLAGPLAAETLLEAKASYFLPADATFRDVYKNGLSFGAEIRWYGRSGIGLWGGGDVFSKTGRLTFTGETTKISVIPLYAGASVRARGKVVRPYAAAGAALVLFKETNPIGRVSGGRLGFVGQVGLLVKLAGWLALDLKGDYLYAKAKPADVAAHLGGFRFGLGLALGL